MGAAEEAWVDMAPGSASVVMARASSSAEQGSAHGEEMLSRGLRHQMVPGLGCLPTSAFLHLPPPFYLLLRPDWFSSNIDLCFRCRCNTYPLQTASLSAPSFLCHLPAVTAAFTSPVCSNTSLCMKDIPTSPLLRQCRFPGATLSPPYACK